MTDARDFAAEAAELNALLVRQRDVAVARLRTLHEAWARTLLGISPKGELVAATRARVEGGLDAALALKAAEQLAQAEQWQWEIGTWSSGSGEGLASMFEVRTLQLAQAWLHAARASVEPAASPRALALAAEVENDPNRIAEPLQQHWQALAAYVAQRS